MNRERDFGKPDDTCHDGAVSTVPDWALRYDDVLTPDLRGDLAFWRAAAGVKPDERTLAGPPPRDDREAAYHRRLIWTIDARHGEALRVWETRIAEYVGRRDEQTTELAKQIDQLQRRGVGADRVLHRAAARGPLPVGHATSALAYRVKMLTSPRTSRPAPDSDPFPRAPQRDSGRGLIM